MSEIQVAGIDLSLTCSGVVVVRRDLATRDWYAREVLVQSIAPTREPASRYRLAAGRPRKEDWVVPAWVTAARLERLAQGVLATVGSEVDLAVIEAPSYGSLGGKAYERAGLFWMVCTGLSTWGVPFTTVAPTARAKYATGHGDAGKSSVVAASLATYQQSSTDDNIADAMVLAAMGCRASGFPLEQGELPEDQESALRSVLWPRGEGER